MENKTLKLNYKRTFYMGFAFFAILMLWQMYNYYCPKMLESILGAGHEYLIGIIMAADNFFAIFMLPLFGALSDKTKSKFGKRMPYMVIGMILSVVVFPLIAVAYYKDTVVGVVIMMALILVIMNMYRNPAVALMPDVTPKPLRSQANGIINLVGYIGAVLGGGIALVIGFIFKDLKSQAITAFLVASFFMLLALVILILKINENKIIEEMKEEMELGEKLAENFKSEDPKKQLSKQDKKNTFILLFALLFWFISFNAVETFYSIFCSKAFPDASYVGTIVMAGLPLSSIITFLLTINLPVKLGRKNCILIGLIAIIISFGIIVLQGLIGYNVLIFIVAIITCGIGWALINANSYPMLVEVANSDNLGRYTGLYYTFSMVAQSVTPILVGFLITIREKYDILFIYSLVAMIIAFVIFYFFKENKKKIEKKSALEAFDE